MTIPPRKQAQFPRSAELPSQSPVFWAKEKERYLRQLAISDFQQITKRYLIVYYADCLAPVGAEISGTDDVFLNEVLQKVPPGAPIDVLIETNGGYTDAAEKLVAQLRQKTPDIRVLVPRRAKSNGTLIALAGASIVMGPASELGPIDPFLVIGPDVALPVHIILRTPREQVDPFIYQSAELAFNQTKRLAVKLLKEGMLAGESQETIEKIVRALATRDEFHSHGAVIDAGEASTLGLKIEKLAENETLWQWLWLLRCMYEQDSNRLGLAKIIESEAVSQSIRIA